MTLGRFFELFSQYGLIFLFVIIFLEYLNFPGLGAAVIMPAIGMLIKKTGISFLFAILLSVAAGMLASYVLYIISFWLGNPILRFCERRLPKVAQSLKKTEITLSKYGKKGVLIGRLIPGIRTLVPVISGAFKMDIINFSVSSLIGIAIWNFTLIYLGYAFGYLWI